MRRRTYAQRRPLLISEYATAVKNKKARKPIERELCHVTTFILRRENAQSRRAAQ